MKEKPKIESLEKEKQSRAMSEKEQAHLLSIINAKREEETAHLRGISTLEELEFNSNINLLTTKIGGWLSSVKNSDKRHKTLNAMYLAAVSIMTYQMNQKSILVRAEKEYRKQREMHLRSVSRVAELEKQIKILKRENEFLQENNN